MSLSDKGKNNHGDEASQLTQDNGEEDKAEKDTPMAIAAKVRKRPLMPINSNGFCMPFVYRKEILAENLNKMEARCVLSSDSHRLIT